MNGLEGFNFGLGTLPLLSDARTRSICAENPTGEKGGGARAEMVAMHGLATTMYMAEILLGVNMFPQ